MTSEHVTMKKREVIKNEYTQKKDKELRDKELYALLFVRQGGKTTICILDSLFKRPCNANQLSEKLGVNYNTIRFHVKIILEHEFIERMQIGNSYVLYPSEKLIKKYDEYLFIRNLVLNE